MDGLLAIGLLPLAFDFRKRLNFISNGYSV